MRLRNGRPPDPLDAALADPRRIWGDAARIDVTPDDDGNYVITVKCRNDLPWTASWSRVDSRTVLAKAEK